MFCGGDQDAFFLQACGVTHAGHVATNSFNLKAIKVAAAENNACSSGGREYPEGNVSPTVQPYTFALNRSPKCLFKWQVIPTKQITPAAAWAYVVFLQQIVALHVSYMCPIASQMVTKAELLLFYWIDFGHSRVKKRVSRMDVIGDIQDNLLRSGFAIPVDDRHTRRIDALELFPVAVNLYLFIAVTIPRITNGKAFLQRQMS